MPPRNWKKRALKDPAGPFGCGRGFDGRADHLCRRRPRDQIFRCQGRSGHQVSSGRGESRWGFSLRGSSRAVSRRARELGIRLVRQGIKDKGSRTGRHPRRKKAVRRRDRLSGGRLGGPAGFPARRPGHCRGRQHSGIEAGGPFYHRRPRRAGGGAGSGRGDFESPGKMGADHEKIFCFLTLSRMMIS